MVVRFAEPGARWRTVAYGPVLCLIVLIGDLIVTHRVHWFGLSFCALLLAGFVSLQVVAGRRHASVELTDTTLRDGAETLDLADIAEILPPPDEDSYDDEKWESARALGELSGVPRRRTGIGLLLRSGGMVQAWARDHHALRAELEAALERLPAVEPEGAAAESGSGAGESADLADAPDAGSAESGTVVTEPGSAESSGAAAASGDDGEPTESSGAATESDGSNLELGEIPAENAGTAAEPASEPDGTADR